MKKRYKLNSFVVPASKAGLTFGLIAGLSLIFLFTSCSNHSGSSPVGPTLNPELDPNLFAVTTMNGGVDVEELPPGTYSLTKVNYMVHEGAKWGVAYQPLAKRGNLALSDQPAWRNVGGTDSLDSLDGLRFQFPKVITSDGNRTHLHFDRGELYRPDLRHRKWNNYRDEQPIMGLNNVVLDGRTDPGHYQVTDQRSQATYDTYFRLSGNYLTVLQVGKFADDRLVATRLTYIYEPSSQVSAGSSSHRSGSYSRNPPDEGTTQLPPRRNDLNDEY